MVELTTMPVIPVLNYRVFEFMELAMNRVEER